MSIISRLRRTHPYLTPGWAGEDDPVKRLIQSPPILRRMIEPPKVPVEYAPPPLARPDVEALPPDFASREMPAQVEVGPAPPMVLRRNGRPTDQFIGDGDAMDRALVRRDALAGYQPQKESKKSLFLRTLLSLPMGGLVGRGGVAETLLGAGGIMDRRALDRNWQQGELAKTDEEIGNLRLQRRSGMQDRLLQAQVDRLDNPTPEAPVDKEIGGRILRRKPDGSYETVYEPPAKPDMQRPLIRSVTHPDGSTRTAMSRDNGQTWVDVPELRGQAKPDNSQFENEQIQSTLAQIEAEQKTLGPSPPTEIDEVELDQNYKPQVVGKKVNPAYLDWAKRWRELDDQKRQLQLKRKPTASRGTQTVKPARDDKYHYTPAQIRASLQPGQSYEEIYAKLKANPKVVIEGQ